MLKELSVEDKSLDIKLKKAHGIVDVLKKIDSIKNKDERDEIRRTFLGNLSDFAEPSSPLAIEADTQSQAGVLVEQPAKRSSKKVMNAIPLLYYAQSQASTSSPVIDKSVRQKPLRQIKKTT